MDAKHFYNEIKIWPLIRNSALKLKSCFLRKCNIFRFTSLTTEKLFLIIILPQFKKEAFLKKIKQKKQKYLPGVPIQIVPANDTS